MATTASSNRKDDLLQHLEETVDFHNSVDTFPSVNNSSVRTSERTLSTHNLTSRRVGRSAMQNSGGNNSSSESSLGGEILLEEQVMYAGTEIGAVDDSSGGCDDSKNSQSFIMAGQITKESSSFEGDTEEEEDSEPVQAATSTAAGNPTTTMTTTTWKPRLVSMTPSGTVSSNKEPSLVSGPSVVSGFMGEMSLKGGDSTKVSSGTIEEGNDNDSGEEEEEEQQQQQQEQKAAKKTSLPRRGRPSTGGHSSSPRSARYKNSDTKRFENPRRRSRSRSQDAATTSQRRRRRSHNAATAAAATASVVAAADIATSTFHTSGSNITTKRRSNSQDPTVKAGTNSGGSPISDSSAHKPTTSSSSSRCRSDHRGQSEDPVQEAQKRLDERRRSRSQDPSRESNYDRMLRSPRRGRKSSTRDTKMTRSPKRHIESSSNHTTTSDLLSSSTARNMATTFTPITMSDDLTSNTIVQQDPVLAEYLGNDTARAFESMLGLERAKASSTHDTSHQSSGQQSNEDRTNTPPPAHPKSMGPPPPPPSDDDEDLIPSSPNDDDDDDNEDSKDLSALSALERFQREFPPPPDTSVLRQSNASMFLSPQPQRGKVFTTIKNPHYSPPRAAVGGGSGTSTHSRGSNSANKYLDDRWIQDESLLRNIRPASDHGPTIGSNNTLGAHLSALNKGHDSFDRTLHPDNADERSCGSADLTPQPPRRKGSKRLAGQKPKPTTTTAVLPPSPPPLYDDEQEEGDASPSSPTRKAHSVAIGGKLKSPQKQFRKIASKVVKTSKSMLNGSDSSSSNIKSPKSPSFRKGFAGVKRPSFGKMDGDDDDDDNDEGNTTPTNARAGRETKNDGAWAVQHEDGKILSPNRTKKRESVLQKAKHKMSTFLKTNDSKNDNKEKKPDVWGALSDDSGSFHFGNDLKDLGHGEEPLGESGPIPFESDDEKQEAEKYVKDREKKETDYQNVHLQQQTQKKYSAPVMIPEGGPPSVEQTLKVKSKAATEKQSEGAPVPADPEKHLLSPRKTRTRRHSRSSSPSKRRPRSKSPSKSPYSTRRKSRGTEEEFQPVEAKVPSRRNSKSLNQHMAQFEGEEDYDRANERRRCARPRSQQSRPVIGAKSRTTAIRNSTTLGEDDRGKQRHRSSKSSSTRRSSRSSSPHSLRSHTAGSGRSNRSQRSISNSPGAYRGSISKRRETMQKIRSARSLKNLNLLEDDDDLNTHISTRSGASGTDSRASTRQHATKELQRSTRSLTTEEIGRRNEPAPDLEYPLKPREDDTMADQSLKDLVKKAKRTKKRREEDLNRESERSGAAESSSSIKKQLSGRALTESVEW